MTTKRKAGRPPSAEAILDKVGLQKLCDEIADGKTLRQLCAELGVDRGSLRRWMSLTEERTKQITEARITAAEAFVDEADDGIKKARNAFQLAKAKERGYHLRWRASKADPRRFGDKLAVGGADDLPPINQSLTVEFIGAKQPEPGT